MKRHGKHMLHNVNIYINPLQDRCMIVLLGRKEYLQIIILGHQRIIKVLFRDCRYAV